VQNLHGLYNLRGVIKIIVSRWVRVAGLVARVDTGEMRTKPLSEDL